jgi:glucose-1-phosphate cytidylyltransferase
MKAVILAGGFGTRISEESGIRPKPMVEIGGKPILWHIMKIYSSHGINDFIICCGYKGHMIKEFFSTYFKNNSDFTIDLVSNSVEVHKSNTEPWKVTLVETGHNSMTGERIRRIKPYLKNETFCLTYGDGLSDVNIEELINYHKAQGTIATLTAVQQPGRFGAFNLSAEDTKVNHFQEKPNGSDVPWINGGFFVLEPEALDYIDENNATWEREPLEKLAKDGELSAYRHAGFWQPMDTLRDKHLLEEVWQSGKAPWHEEEISKTKALKTLMNQTTSDNGALENA